MQRGVREAFRHTKGEGAGDPSGSPVLFGSYRAYSLAVILHSLAIGDTMARDLNSSKSRSSLYRRYLDHLAETGRHRIKRTETARAALYDHCKDA